MIETAEQVPTQLQQVRKHILRFGRITSWDAIVQYKITRLSEYIRILRDEGFDIQTVWKLKNKKRYGLYVLKEKE